ncbi:MAG: AMP-binding protein, partial [Gemmatimonadota bacterium]
MSGATVHDLVERQAAERPAAIYALATDSDAALSYGDLARDCRSVAMLLQDLGAAPGDTISIVMPNGLATLRVLLGAMWGGRCVNPVNLLAQPDQMRYVLAHSDCKVVVVAPDWEARVRDLLAGIERRVEVLVTDPDALRLPGEHAGADEPPPPAPDALALLMYTSGTTGKPKGVMLTQANLAANAHAIAAEHGLGVEDRVLAVLPLYHINAF